MAIRTRPDEEPDTEEQIKQWAIKRSPPVLISAVVHMIVIIIMGLWAVRAADNANLVVLSASYTDVEGEQLIDSSFNLQAPNEQSVATVTTQAVPSVINPFESKVSDVLPIVDTAATVAAPSVPLAARGSEGIKNSLLSKYGGNPDTEAAVQAGLEWLARHQNKNGTWSLKATGADIENIESATAMALLAFQGAGNTHTKGKYQRAVTDGFRAMLRAQDREGNFFHGVRADDRFYTQAQCTIVLAELYGMTHDTQLKAPLELAIKHCLDAQDMELGGWRYVPGNGSDTSVTGWMVMALQSAKNAGIEVPEERLKLIHKYLDSASPVGDGARYVYMPLSQDSRQEPTYAMTAEALLCREYLGWKQTDPRLQKGAEMVVQNLPDYNEERDVYFWYYATQMLFHLEGPYWEKWNTAMRDTLISHQEKAGKERGSWDHLGKQPDLWASKGVGGRLYTTCLSLYMLEVYYRHLPMYSKLKKQLEGAK